jgi:pseudouridine-5'-phosphate glycosidase
VSHSILSLIFESLYCARAHTHTHQHIAIRNGVCRVGLSLAELEDLAQAGPQGRAIKVSTRELSLLLSKHRLQNYASNINGYNYSDTSSG